jgi:hypothetical protein
MYLLVICACCLAAGVIAVLAIVYFLQDYMIFPGAGHQGSEATRFTPPPGAELIQLSTDHGKVAALYGPALLSDGRADPAAETRTTLLYFYGNGSFIAKSLGSFEKFRRLGVNVLVPDYAGYGMSEGSASERSLYATADAAYEYLVEIRVCEPGRIIAGGASLGGAVAIDLASRRKVGGLVVFNGFTSMRDMARRTLPWFPSGLLLKHRFENQTKIAGIACRKFICNGMKDEIVPPEMADRLAKAAGDGRPVMRVRVAEAGHNTIFTASEGEVFGALGEFLKGV